MLHLKLAELEAATWPLSATMVEQWRALIARRKAKRASLSGRPLIDPRYFIGNATASDAVVSGTPGSAGVAEGPVRIVNSPAEFSKLQAGDVLVAAYTNPTWTALFQRAAAVVVDTGGAGSHAAIVAREYGVPAVMGTRDGTRRLQDGQRVRVDGGAGRVFVLNLRGMRKHTLRGYSRERTAHTNTNADTAKRGA